ncbi:MAG: SRPBCC family protein [Nitriliruptoraceae bacterium]
MSDSVMERAARLDRSRTVAGSSTFGSGMRLEVTAIAGAPVEAVWRVLTNWEQQPAWMLDAKSVEVLTPQRAGVGTTIRCPTNLFGVTVDDVMRVTVWRPPDRLEIQHLGKIISGVAGFELSPVPADPSRTSIAWWEQIDPPLGAVGEFGATRIVRPVLDIIFTRSLRNLVNLVEAEAASGN